MGYTTEEEQVEMLKRWWRESGASIIGGIVLAIALIFGWQGWQKHQLEQKLAASVIYQQLGDAWGTVSQAGATEKDENTYRHLVHVLQDEHGSSVYAQLGTLQLARFLVERDDLPAARAQLKWVLDNDPAEPVAEVAQLRLAQVLLAEKDAAGALALLDANPPAALEVDWQELRGDVLMQMQRQKDAVLAYQKADELATAMGQRRPLLELKLDDLAASAEES